MTMLLGRSPAYSDSDESIISTNSVQVKIFNLRTLWDIFSSHSRTCGHIMFPKKALEKH